MFKIHLAKFSAWMTNCYHEKHTWEPFVNENSAKYICLYLQFKTNRDPAFQWSTQYSVSEIFWATLRDFFMLRANFLLINWAMFCESFGNILIWSSGHTVPNSYLYGWNSYYNYQNYRKHLPRFSWFDENLNVLSFNMRTWAALIDVPLILAGKWSHFFGITHK